MIDHHYNNNNNNNNNKLWVSLNSRPPFKPYHWCPKRTNHKRPKKEALSSCANGEQLIGIFRSIMLVGNKLLAVINIEVFWPLCRPD